MNTESFCRNLLIQRRKGYVKPGAYHQLAADPAGGQEAERLIVNKNYNLVMVKARQTLECMVRCMAEKACLVEGDLSDTIDQLYEGGWINKTTKDNYHTIRILGNKAVHENDNTAYNPIRHTSF